MLTHEDVLKMTLTLTESDATELYNTGLFNSITKGYVIEALRDVGADRREIDIVLRSLTILLDELDAANAVDSYRTF